MQPYVSGSSKDASARDFQIKETLTATLKNRFATYGYQQIGTSAFEYYDLYSSIAGTVNKDEMLKVIDSSGKVLVLRPDMTIPIARMVSSRQAATAGERLFYVQNVFRQTDGELGSKESTQAGVEYFGENTAENNAEIIMLAVHTLRDLEFANFKIEIGHAGFFKELIKQAKLSRVEIEQLQAMIQSKNTTDIETFLAGFELEEELKIAIKKLPHLHGNPAYVIPQAEEIVRNDAMQELLQNLRDVYEVLEAYEVEDAAVFNLGLINNMNYYTGVIFQGFVENFGKPVMMGGRYDNLGEQFGSPLPAIGFAFDIDDLLQARKQQKLSVPEPGAPDFVIEYTAEKQRDAFRLAYQLREKGLTVLTFPAGSSGGSVAAKRIKLSQDGIACSPLLDEWADEDKETLAQLFPEEKGDE
ncbi:ATP phosphoribosyltransferase regulatory subunit [Lentibacillus sediminis]|uniref:ATP phosphoribosyltransferase regulatory subunit n=1 Tax=Lentibacillus sediminis TaxID=1940529 RepID=UPI000C1C6E6B|nr:ATP phosphoribosyltransferase regulatory subunit [Lentibacillus sediminis]